MSDRLYNFKETRNLPNGNVQVVRSDGASLSMSRDQWALAVPGLVWRKISEAGYPKKAGKYFVWTAGSGYNPETDSLNTAGDGFCLDHVEPATHWAELSLPELPKESDPT